MARNNLEVVKKSRSDRYNVAETKEKEKVTKTKTVKKKIKPKKDEEIEEKEFNPILKKILIFLVIIIVLFISYSMFIEPNLLNVKEYKLESNKISTNFHGTKIIQFSDLNYGTHFTEKDLIKLVDKINELKPDILLFNGNLIDSNIKIDENNKKVLIKELSRIDYPLYKYAVYGSNDYNQTFEHIMNESGFTILDNEFTLLYYKDETPIVLYGFNLNKKEIDYNKLNEPIDEIDTTNFYKIVLSHSPNIMDNLKSQKPDLVLSGSTLGGLIDLEFTKPLFLNETKYYEDYYKINKTELYISNGLGTSNINMRFNNVPSFNFFRLYKK